MTKDELRARIKQLKRVSTRDELATYSEHIVSELETNAHFIKARNIFIYYSLPHEVDTVRLIERIADRKNIILPVVNGNDLILKSHNGKLRDGAFNIKEPTGDTIADYSIIDLAIVPGEAFDTAGNRLGHGKGYYDRTLSSLGCHKIGLCFPFQLFDEIPHDEHDIKMDEIITMRDGHAVTLRM